MSHFTITGGRPLEGEIVASGSKNASLAIIAACALCDNICELSNVPRIQDISVMLDILAEIGIEHIWESNRLIIDARHLKNTVIDPTLTCRIRSSVYLLGVLLARTGEGRLGQPLIDSFCRRPIDFHIDGLVKMGARIEQDQEGMLLAYSPKGLQGTEINLPFPSLGATCQLLLAASMAKGITTITNASNDPEICDLCGFLLSLGTPISGIGTRTLRVEGRTRLRGHCYQVMADHAEVATYMLAGVTSRGRVTVNQCNYLDLLPLIELLSNIGAQIRLTKQSVTVECRESLLPFQVQTGPRPAFHTDWQPQISVLAVTCQGISKVRESYYPERFTHVEELQKLGARISMNEGEVEVVGPTLMHGNEVRARDIRGGAALVIAGLVADGQTVVYNAEVLDRAYECIEDKLSLLGAKISRDSLGSIA